MGSTCPQATLQPILIPSRKTQIMENCSRYPSNSSLQAVVVTHSHGSPAALVQSDLLPIPGEIRSLIWPLGVLKVRGSWRAFGLGMHLSAGDQKHNLECCKQKKIFIFLTWQEALQQLPADIVLVV